MVVSSVFLLNETQESEFFFPPPPQRPSGNPGAPPENPVVGQFDVTFTPVKSQPLFARDSGVSEVGLTSFVEELAEAFNKGLRDFDPSLLDDMFFFAVPGFDQRVRLCLKTVNNANTQFKYFTFVIETKFIDSDQAFALGGFDDGKYYSSVPFLYEDSVATGVVTPVAAPFFLGELRYVDIHVDEAGEHSPLERVFLSGLKGSRTPASPMRLLRDPIRVLKELTVRPVLQDGSTPVLVNGDGFDYSFDVFHLDQSQRLPPKARERAMLL